MTRKLLDDCFAHDQVRLSHDAAVELLRARVGVVADVETVPLVDAAGRIIAETVCAPRPVPAHTNAAVDGYSFAATGYDRATGSALPVAARVTAGAGTGGAAPGALTAARIFTGAVMPAGHDTVAMQEDCEIAGPPDSLVVRIPPGLKAGANVRRAGEDVAAGEVLFEPGAVLRPQDLAALASVGRSNARVRRRLRVGVLSSGDEVVRIGAPLAHGEVYDANMPMLQALIASAGAQALDLGVAPDRPEAVEASLAAAAHACDVIVTSGGASKGEEDHMVRALERLGQRHLWQLAIKPGRPMSFGQIGDSVVLGLPGNPVAVLVCFLLYAWPLLRRMGGAAWPEPRRFMLPAAFEFTGRKTGRREFWRGMYVTSRGHMAVDKFARDGSGLISGLRAADGLIDIPEAAGDVRRGDLVAFIPFTEFGIVR